MTLFGGFQIEIERGTSKNMTFVFSNIVSTLFCRKTYYVDLFKIEFSRIYILDRINCYRNDCQNYASYEI